MVFCFIKNFSFRTFLVTSLHVICGLALPQSKILATPLCTLSMFFLNFNYSWLKNNHFQLHLNCACAIALKTAKILAAQAPAQPLKNNCGASAIASKLVAPQKLRRKCLPLRLGLRHFSSMEILFISMWFRLFYIFILKIQKSSGSEMLFLKWQRYLYTFTKVGVEPPLCSISIPKPNQ